MSIEIHTTSEVIKSHLQAALGSYDSGDDVFTLEESNQRISLSHDKKVVAEYQLPLKIGLLLSAIKSVMNKKNQKEKAKPINLKKYTLFPAENKLQHTKTKEEIFLTDKEFDILMVLYKHHPQKMMRDDLLHKIWGYGEGIETHTLETHIYRLRQKVESDPAEPDFLKTDDDGYYLNIWDLYI